MINTNECAAKTCYDVTAAYDEIDMQNVESLRKEVFGLEQSYSEEDIRLTKATNEYYLLCRKSGIPVGTQTYQIGYKSGDVDIEKYFKLSDYYEKYGKIIFCSRNCVKRNHRNTIVALLLYYHIYKICLSEDITFIVTDCKVNNRISMRIFPKLGFKEIGKTIKGKIGPVIIWGAEISAITEMQISDNWRLIDHLNSCGSN